MRNSFRCLCFLFFGMCLLGWWGFPAQASIGREDIVLWTAGTQDTLTSKDSVVAAKEKLLATSKDSVRMDSLPLGRGPSLEKPKPQLRLLPTRRDTALYSLRSPRLISTTFSPNASEINSFSFLSLLREDLNEALSTAKQGIPQKPPSVVMEIRYYLFIGVLLLCAFFLPNLSIEGQAVRKNYRVRTQLSQKHLGVALFVASSLTILLSEYISSLHHINVGQPSSSAVYAVPLFLWMILFYGLSSFFLVALVNHYCPFFYPVFYRVHYLSNILLLMISLVVFLITVTDVVLYNPWILVVALLLAFVVECGLLLNYIFLKSQQPIVQKIGLGIFTLLMFFIFRASLVVVVFKTAVS